MPTLVAESPVRSLKAGDPDYTELLELFSSEVAQRATEMQHLFARGDLEQLRVMAHQMKGAGRGYGFPELTDIAGRLEASCKTGDLAEVVSGLSDVVDYLLRIEC
jgi:HPt (histidine-containing phosphotransfer) domain-containing protein